MAVVVHWLVRCNHVIVGLMAAMVHFHPRAHDAKVIHSLELLPDILDRTRGLSSLSVLCK